MNHNIVILGHHNFGLSLVLETIYTLKSETEVTIVSNLPEDENTLSEFPYLPGGMEVSHKSIKNYQPCDGSKFILSTISPGSRRALQEVFNAEKGIKKNDYTCLIHPHAYVASTSILSPGSYVGPMSTIAPYGELGDFLFMNRNASIGHHCKIGNYVSISPGVSVSSQVEIGDNTWIAPGVTIKDGIKIGTNCLIGLGSVVLDDIEDNSVAYGTPARFIRLNV